MVSYIWGLATCAKKSRSYIGQKYSLEAWRTEMAVSEEEYFGLIHPTIYDICSLGFSLGPLVDFVAADWTCCCGI